MLALALDLRNCKACSPFSLNWFNSNLVRHEDRQMMCLVSSVKSADGMAKMASEAAAASMAERPVPF